MNIQINWDYANAHSFPFYHPGKSHVGFELSNVMGLSLVQAKAMQRSKSCRDKGLIPVLSGTLVSCLASRSRTEQSPAPPWVGGCRGCRAHPEQINLHGLLGAND